MRRTMRLAMMDEAAAVPSRVGLGVHSWSGAPPVCDRRWKQQRDSRGGVVRPLHIGSNGVGRILTPTPPWLGIPHGFGACVCAADLIVFWQAACSWRPLARHGGLVSHKRCMYLYIATVRDASNAIHARLMMAQQHKIGIRMYLVKKNCGEMPASGLRPVTPIHRHTVLRTLLCMYKQPRPATNALAIPPCFCLGHAAPRAKTTTAQQTARRTDVHSGSLDPRPTEITRRPFLLS
jgi:hypothetical protein